MGFPENGEGYGIREGERRTTEFTTWVDGRRVAAQRVPARVTRKDYSLKPQAYWVKRVTFARGQRRLVRVRFRVPMKQWAWFGGERFADYNLTGGNWHGAARETVVTAVLHTPGTYVVGATFQGGLQPLQQRGNTFTFRRTQWKWHEAEGALLFRFLSTLPDWMVLRREGPLGLNLDHHYTVVLPGKPVPTKGNLELGFTPPAMLRNGIAFISLGHWRDWLNSQDRADEAGDVEVSRVGASGTWRLKAGDYSLNFPTGQARIEIAGQSPVALPAPSFEVGGGFTYVPLAPLLRIFHGTAQVDAGGHRINLKVPPFWKTAPN
jgi:hypothetical protein